MLLVGELPAHHAPDGQVAFAFLFVMLIFRGSTCRELFDSAVLKRADDAG